MSTDNDNRLVMRSRLLTTVSTLVIIAVFALAAMLLVTLGMHVYEDVVMTAEDNFELRTSLSYVATRIRQAGGSDHVEVRDMDGIRTLMLKEDIGGESFVTYIYHMDGGLYEYMASAEDEWDPDAGFLTMEIDTFDITGRSSSITFEAGNAAGEYEKLTLYYRAE